MKETKLFPKFQCEIHYCKIHYKLYVSLTISELSKRKRNRLEKLGCNSEPIACSNRSNRLHSTLLNQWDLMPLGTCQLRKQHAMIIALVS